MRYRPNYVYVYGYDPAGNRTSEQIGLGVTQTSVNSLNQITSTGAGGPLQFSGTLSKPSQVTVGGNTATYGNYYSTNFTGLASVTPGTNTVSVVAHDVNGNTATNKYQVVVPPGSSATPAYDGNGNLTNNGNGQTYTWDARDELLSITYANGASSLFTYDGLGRRVSIVEKNSSGTVTGTKQFVWVGATMAEERDASDNVTKRFFPQGEQISGTPYHYTRDHLGSVREMVDNSGNVQARYDYDPYGRVTKVSGSMDSDFQYAGYYAHLPSSLNLTLFRAFDPNTGKWLSRDSLKDPEEGHEPNLYEYVSGNPTNVIDPLGLCGCHMHPVFVWNDMVAIRDKLLLDDAVSGAGAAAFGIAHGAEGTAKMMKGIKTVATKADPAFTVYELAADLISMMAGFHCEYDAGWGPPDPGLYPPSMFDSSEPEGPLLRNNGYSD